MHPTATHELEFAAPHRCQRSSFIHSYTQQRCNCLPQPRIRPMSIIYYWGVLLFMLGSISIYCYLFTTGEYYFWGVHVLLILSLHHPYGAQRSCLGVVIAGATAAPPPPRALRAAGVPPSASSLLIDFDYAHLTPNAHDVERWGRGQA